MAKKDVGEIGSVREVPVESLGKKLGRRVVGNPAYTGAAITADPHENAKYLMHSLEIANLPTIDLNDPEQVKARINEYFAIVQKNGMKPTVAGYGNALNAMDRRELWEIRTGNYRHAAPPRNVPPESADFIKKGYKIMEELWESYMENGKINPVSGIFLGKNNFGYQDKTDVVVTPNNPDSEYSAADIASRYSLPEPKDDENQ